MNFGLPEFLFVVLILIYCITLPKILARANQKSWLSYIPVLQFIPFVKAIGRPWYWVLLLLVPGVNFIMMAIINVELGIVFNYRSTKEQWMFGALPWYRLYTLAFQQTDSTYIGPRSWEGKKKSFGREWGEAILFAVVAATVIRSFFLEAFTIPTPSMEKSMMVGDYLFVSKFSYGTKLPQTPMSVPFVHNALPFNGLPNSYVDWFSLPYLRLPGIGEVERYDPVVFNFPHGDTIIVDPYYAGHDYYSILKNEAMFLAAPYATTWQQQYNVYASNPAKYEAMARKNFTEKKICVSCGMSERSRKGHPIGGIRYRPIDKKENYIKRCIGLPGETLSIEHRKVKINGQFIDDLEGMMHTTLIQLAKNVSIKKIQAKYSANLSDIRIAQIPDSTGNFAPNFFELPLTAKQIEEMTQAKEILWHEVLDDSIADQAPGTMYPNSRNPKFAHWTVDNFGPITIPAEGMTIPLTDDNFDLFQRVIRVYEQHNLVRTGKNTFLLDGQPCSQYTFQQNYYWMMGDNRNNSLDSRYWGFVPEDHVVGKAVFTWFSKADAKYQGHSSIRWDRMFKLVD